ncbi:MAG: PAS domain S-box protein [Cyanomargarita calcarea GSE-NOS-MK-12-04C]|jgi:hypothetical protein|uniref:Circadian input-output histidine kinase CikA n=1 Tax=Cyanomargarita calcarea GSE-NOS-MK-12-04C TaxID=2839659 RepID=A0A951QHA2_9CYAN|nr:PAS domain S-box protein [Cyanomargarita calcarea GSE-NOS-MK-12-04C]
MFNIIRLRLQDLLQTSSNCLLSQAASVFAISIGSAVLIGWCFQIEVGTAMKASTALCLILSGISLWLSSPPTPPTPPSLLVAKICARAVFGIGLLTLGESLLQINFDQGHMGTNTALSFMLVGRALFLLAEPKSSRSYWYIQVLTLITCLISLQSVVGYAYQVKVLYGIAPHITSMTLPTALTFVVLSAGILWARTDEGVMKMVTSDTYAGLLARRLLVVAIAIPLVLGWFIVQGQRASVYDPAFAIELFAIITIVTFVVLIWQNAALIERLSHQHESDRAVIRENEDKLRAFANANVVGIMFGDVKGGIQQANDEYLRIIGYKREDLVANKIRWDEITPPEYLYLDEQSTIEALSTGACTPYEKEYIRFDGSRIPILMGFVLVGEERQESVCFVLDLSKRKEAESALQQSEKRFRLAVDNIPNVFSIYDQYGRFQFVNAVASQITNKLPEEFIGRTDEEVFPPEITQAYVQTLHQAIKTRTLQTTEATVILPNYGKFTTAIKYVPLLDENGEIFQILGITDDITARKEAEDALRNQQKWLEELVNLMPTPLLLIEAGTGRITFANRAAQEMAGGEFPTNVATENYDTVYHVTDAAGNVIPNEETPGARVARGERIDGAEMDWHTPGGVRSLVTYADTLPAIYGHEATCVMVFQDISSLKQVKNALSLGYKRLQLLFETASDLLSSQQPEALVNNLFGKLSDQISLDVYFNYLIEDKELLRLESYSGITEEFASSVKWVKFGQAICGTVAAERRAIYVENVQQSIEPKTELIRSIGITAYYSHPLIAQEKLLGTISFGSRTRSKFSQNEMSMMQAVCDLGAIAMERTSLIASLQQQTEQLSDANRMKDEFLAILSHELRSPLNAILGWAQLLRGGKLNETQISKGIETIERNAKAQTQLIEDLLDISRMIQGKLRLKVCQCDLIPIIDSALDSVSLAAQVREIDLRIFIADRGQSQYLVSGDAGRIQQVIWNLLSNAIKFTPKGGRVELRMSMSANLGSELLAIIQVSDTGIGISPDFLPYVFDRFRQADSSSTRNHGGLGLGLAIVRHIVELHGGTIYAESPGEEQGATFTVKLPLLKTQPSPPLSLSPPPPSFPSFPSLFGVRVLIVDDEADTRDFLVTVLQGCQAEVHAVASVAEALQVIPEWKPDVLVSDIGMPGEDGYSLIRKLRASPPEKGGKIPAAALTAYTRTQDRMRAIQEGFQLHLPKPVEPDELAAVVASLVGRISQITK